MPEPFRSINSIPITLPTGPTGVRVAASRVYGASRRAAAIQMTMQRATNPIPCAHPNTIVSVSNPGRSQNTISAVKIASSTQESRFTQTNSRPGTGFSNGAPGIGSSAGCERGQDYAFLLQRVGAGVTLAGAGPALAADVGELHALGQQLRHAARHHLPGAHVARLLLHPGDLLQVRVGGDQVLQLFLGERVQNLHSGDGDVLGGVAPLAGVDVEVHLAGAQHQALDLLVPALGLVVVQAEVQLAFGQLLEAGGGAVEAQQPLGGESGQWPRLADQGPAGQPL